VGEALFSLENNKAGRVREFQGRGDGREQETAGGAWPQTDLVSSGKGGPEGKGERSGTWRLVVKSAGQRKKRGGQGATARGLLRPCFRSGGVDREGKTGGCSES